ncbi:MAG: hypothetical protein Q7K45_02975 [Nanoarchaeota archaeon]|nr:hypothetical protein [Nanoarchaeota archaeon]
MTDQTIEHKVEELKTVRKFEASVFEVSKELNDHYRGLMYDGGAQQRGFAVDIHDRSAVPKAHKWYAAGVEAAYLALKDSPDVPEYVKAGLASYAGLIHGLENKL